MQKPLLSKISPNNSNFPQNWQYLSLEERRKLARQQLKEENLKFSKRINSVFDLFEKVYGDDPADPALWFQRAIFLFEYGKEKKEKKFFSGASRNFKIATYLDPNIFEVWHAWGKLHFFVAKSYRENHYYLDAQKSYQKAISLSKDQPKDILKDLYWEYGNIWINLGKSSNEAIDIRRAIDAFKISAKYQTKESSQFWKDLGNAYLQMAMLINNNNLYFRSINYFYKAINLQENFEAYKLLASCFIQLYINTSDEKYFLLADKNLKKCTELHPTNYKIWLQWAELLGEVGKVNRDSKKLKLSLEKCRYAYKYNKKDPFIIGQEVESLSLLGAYTSRLDLITLAEDKIIKMIEKKPYIAELWYAYGICLSAYGIYHEDLDFEELAIEKFQQGLSLDRTNAELWQALARATSKIGVFTEQEEILKRALKFYKKALALKLSCSFLIFDYLKTLLKFGEITENQKIIKEATSCLESILSRQKEAILQHPQWLFYYGYALKLLGDLTDEEKYYQRALDIFSFLLHYPDRGYIYYHLAITYYHLADLSLQQKDFQKAIKFFRLASKQDEEDDLTYLEWGLTLISLSQQVNDDCLIKVYLTDAENKIKRAGRLGNQHAYYYLACLYSIRGRIEEAIYLLKKAQRLKILPPLTELLEDEWLEKLKRTQAFTDFLSQLESRKI